MSLFNELKRRNVFKVAAAYIIIGWLTMQAGDTLAPALLLPEWINSALAFFLILGFPLALFFAWAFEMTPEGIKKEKDVDRSQSITSDTGQKLNHTIIALLVLTLGYFVYDKFFTQPGVSESTSIAADESATTPVSEFQTIAVLPFVNMSEDSSNEYFSDGLTEELLNILSKIKELRVAGRTSSFAFKDQHEDLRLIGEKLNVATILEGSVRRDDKRNRVRITAQLINVDDGFHLWSETYDRELNDIFAIQDEIARKVAQAMRITLLGEDEVRLEQVASTEINAYDVYLKALQNLNENSFESLSIAVSQFQQALVLDSSFTPAKLGLTGSWLEMAKTGAITRQEALTRGMPLLEAVLAMQPDNSIARIHLARFRAYQNDNEAAEAAFISALEADPRNARGLQEFGRFLYNNGQVEKGIALIDAALEIEPYAVPVLWEHCQTHAFLQNLTTAQSSCNRIKELSPESPLGWYGEASAYLHTGNIVRGLKGFSDAIERDPGDYEMISAMSNFWVLLGDAEQADKWIQRAEAVGAGQPAPIRARLALYKYREQHDLALDLAKQAIDRKLEDRHGTNYNFRYVWAFESALKQNYQGGLLPYRETFPWAFQSPLESPENLPDQIGDIIQIAALLKLAEPLSERPEELLSLVETRLEEHNPAWGAWGPDISRAAIATIRGQHEEALDWLNKAWDKKWRLGWRPILLDSVVLSQLSGEPGYRELVTRFETDMELQREEAYALMEITK
jgi:TolB-like protein/Tfp pilus assembly protein PilF